jgi:hypothetical protein
MTIARDTNAGAVDVVVACDAVVDDDLVIVVSCDVTT